jgi:hypothetical protein
MFEVCGSHLDPEYEAHEFFQNLLAILEVHNNMTN